MVNNAGQWWWMVVNDGDFADGSWLAMDILVITGDRKMVMNGISICEWNLASREMGHPRNEWRF